LAEEPQDIETLRRRYEQLSTRKTEAETLLNHAKQELERLKADALAKYGTDDLESLQKKLQEMEEANLRKRREYQKLLDTIEEDLRKVEEKYAE
jgi:hypothetical protein